MKILAIDTSSTACSVALLIDNQILSIHEVAPMQQAQKILPMIESVLRDASLSLNQVDALAFGCGPGSFTGVRIGTSVIQGIGYALNLPIIAISSLAALAQAAYEELGWKNLLVGVDARIQEVYWGAYQVNSIGCVELIGKEMVCIPEEVILPKGKDWFAVGNAWAVYPKQISFKLSKVDSSRLPMATGILTLAKYKYAAKDWSNAQNVLPTYLRDEVAKKS